MKKNPLKNALIAFVITSLAAFGAIFALFFGFGKDGAGIPIGVLSYFGISIAYFIYAFSQIELNFKTAKDFNTTTTTYTFDRNDNYTQKVKNPQDKAKEYNRTIKIWLGIFCCFLAPVGFLIFTVVFAKRVVDNTLLSDGAQKIVCVLMVVGLLAITFFGGYWLPYGKKDVKKGPVTLVNVHVGGTCFNPFHQTHSFVLRCSYLDENGKEIVQNKTVNAEVAGVTTTMTFEGDFDVRYEINSLQNCIVESGGAMGTVQAGERITIVVNKD